MKVALFKLGENQPQRMLVIIHHLIVDGVSWRILLEDLEQIYQQLSQQQSVHLPLKTTSFKQWSQFLQEYAQSSQLQREQEYWLKQPLEIISPLPIDYPEGRNTVGVSRTVSVSLSIEDTKALLQDVPIAYHTQINDVLLTALVQSFASWTGRNSLLVDLEGHGRESIDNNINLTRTIGWFTTIFPVLLTLTDTSRPTEALKTIQEQLKKIPNRGIGYGVLRYLNQTSSTSLQSQNLSQSEVRFNYLGQFDTVLPENSLFKLVNQCTDSSRSLLSNRRYLLDINAFIFAGKLQLEWTYSEEIHQKSTIEQIANEFIKVLMAIIFDCGSTTADGYTPLNFPNAELSQKELDDLLAQINLGSEK
jgi:non-ribosomal peptide synthase protein (TIGR01720 family)